MFDLICIGIGMFLTVHTFERKEYAWSAMFGFWTAFLIASVI